MSPGAERAGLRMALLLLSLLLGLQSDGGKGQETLYRFSRPDQQVSLPCGQLSKSIDCSRLQWLSNTLSPNTLTEATEGRINPRSPRSDRLNLTSDCSLLVGQVSDRDVGFYTCRIINDHRHDVRVYLSLLKIYPIPPDHDPRKDDGVLLECILIRDLHPPSCDRNRLLWVDEGGAEVTDGVSQTRRGADCLSYLEVTRQSRNKKKLTCQVVSEQHTVELEADYTPFTGDDGGSLGDNGGPGPGPGPGLTDIIVGVLVLLLLLVITTVVLVKLRSRARGPEDTQAPTQEPDEWESTLTYATVFHGAQAASKKQAAVEQEEVTYSTVRSAMRTEDVGDPISLNCSVKPR